MTPAEREGSPPPPEPAAPAAPPAEGARPIEWPSITHRFVIAGHKGYLVVAAEHGRPVHLEIHMSKAGGVLRGLLHCLSASICLGLESGVPLSKYFDALAYQRFEPSGWSKDAELGYAHSIVDYVFRWLRRQFPRADVIDAAEAAAPPEVFAGETCSVCGAPATWGPGEPCPECGQIEAEAA